jgi:hypothetical protein
MACLFLYLLNFLFYSKVCWGFIWLQKAQLKLQDIEIQSLQASLVEEQQRYRRLKEDGDTETACLHSQFQQLQQGHDLYLSKAQKLQVSTHE